MSMGSIVGDFVALGKLARDLYKDVYKVARAAPAQLGALEKELGLLSQAIQLLVDELQNPSSTLRKAGDYRIRMVNEMKDQAHETLKSLEHLVKKHDLARLAVGSDRSAIKRAWDKLTFVKDARSIDSLRSKLVYHYSVMQLLLTSVGNSSLQRLEDGTHKIDTNVRDIMSMLARVTLEQSNSRSVSLPPAPVAVSGFEHIGLSPLLARNFLAEAEKAGPWLSIGVRPWLQAGKWWMLKARCMIPSSQPFVEIDHQAYLDLLKASWIVTDVLSIQYRGVFITDSETLREILEFSFFVKRELEKTPQATLSSVLTSSRILACNFTIWSEVAGSSLDITDESVWLSDSMQESEITLGQATQRNPIIFRRFGQYFDSPIHSTQCIVIVTLEPDHKAVRLLCQNASGHDLVKVNTLSTSIQFNVGTTEEHETEKFSWDFDGSFSHFLPPESLSLAFDDRVIASDFLISIAAARTCFINFSRPIQDTAPYKLLHRCYALVFRLALYDIRAEVFDRSWAERRRLQPLRKAVKLLRDFLKAGVPTTLSKTLELIAAASLQTILHIGSELDAWYCAQRAGFNATSMSLYAFTQMLLVATPDKTSEWLQDLGYGSKYFDVKELPYNPCRRKSLSEGAQSR